MIWQHNHAKNQLQNQALSQAHLYNKESSAQRPVKVKKMNANKYFEEMQKQKEAEERERLEEQRYLPEFTGYCQHNFGAARTSTNKFAIEHALSLCRFSFRKSKN